MATDIIARGIAVSNSGGGGGGTGVEIQSGAGIKLDGSDPVVISNSGVTDVQTGSAEASNGTIRVVIAGKDSESKDVPVKGLADAAYKNVDTVVNESTKNSNDIPTTKAVKEALDKKVDTNKLEDSNGVATLDENKKLKSAQLPSHNHGSNEINVMTGYSKPSTLADKSIKNTDTLNDAIGKLEKSLDDKMDNGNYAASSTKGGSATSAEKLTNTEQIGTNTKPVYFSADGVPVAIEHTIGSDVPANAKFTDTTYSSGTGIRINDDTIHNMGVLSVSESTTNGCVDITIGKNGTETSENKTVPVHGLGSAAYKNVDTTVTKDSANLITSDAVASGLAGKIDTSKRNTANGVAGLDANKKIDVSQIPTTDTYDTNSAYPVTGKAIEAAMNTLPNPMIYKGSLGTGGTITALPPATKANEGFTYKVITAGTYSNQSAKIGDVFISNGTEWTIIPSGDEPDGTVTSVGISVPTGLKIKSGTSPITTSGTIEVQLDDGYVIPKTSDIVPSTRTVNGKALSSNITLNASDVGLGNVGNFKAVSTVASQGLTDTEKSNARTNIGAGTSSLTLGETSSTAYRGDRGKIAYEHTLSTAGTNPHGTTKSDVGLGNVPNVATNDQTPSYTEASTLAKLTSGEKLSVSFGKISKAVTDLISHLADTVKHITSTERTNWGTAYTHSQSAHAPSSAQANVIETVKVNGTALTPSSKAVNITVPVTTDTYTSTGTAPVSGKAVASAIGGLDVTGASGIGQGKTIKSWSETDGKVSITTQDIKITKSQVSDFPTSMTPTAHNQASSTINAMTSYSKATSSSAIATSDTLNAAVGKLEYKADLNAANIAKNKTNISTLKKHVTGELTDSDFQEDSTAVMTKTVPAGMSDYAAVKMIGGKTVKRNITNPDNATLHQTSYSNGTWSNALVDTKTEPTSVFYTYKDETRVGNNIINSTPLSDGRRWATFTKDSTFNRGVIGHIGASKDAFVRLDLSGCVDGKTYTCSYRISGNPSTVGGLKITEAMIEEGSTANSYLPYGLCNAPVESVVSAGRNILDLKLQTNAAQGNITCVKNGAQYTISCSATASETASFRIDTDVKVRNGMKIIGCPTGGGSSAYELLVSDGTNTVRDYGSGATINFDSDKAFVNMVVRSGATISSSKVFKPFIGTGEYSEPYKTTLLLPDSDRNLPCFGYGISETVQNVRDYENGTYTQMVAEVDLGDLNWVRNGDDGNRFYCDISTMKTSSAITNGICSLYNRNTVDWKSLNNKEFCLGQNINSKGANIAIRDDSYTDATAFKEAMKGVKLVYELATPIVTDCSDMLHPIRVESGGTITFTNEHSLDVPNTITYKKEVSING